MTDPENHGEITPKVEEAHEGHGTLMARFAWAMVGPLLWAGLLLPIAKGPGWLTLWEIAFLAIMGIMSWGKYAEYRSGRGTTLYGEPATRENCNAYWKKLVILSSISWMVAKLVGRSIYGW